MPPQESIRVGFYTKDWTARQAMRQVVVGVQMLDVHIANLEFGITTLQERVSELQELLSKYKDSYGELYGGSE